MSLRLILIGALSVAIIGCASTGRIPSTDPHFTKVSKCGANIVKMISADVTLQIRVKNAARVGELSPGLETQVKKQAEDHPSAEYMKVVVADIGTTGLRDAIDKERSSLAGLLAEAKLRHGGDRILVIQELLPQLETDAQSACKEAGYFFSALKRVSTERLTGSVTSGPTNDVAQPLRAGPTSSPFTTSVVSRPPQESMVPDETAPKEQATRRQPEQVDTDWNAETTQNEAAAKKRARSLIRAANPQERTLIKNAISKSLFDAESARFGEVRLIPQSLACAEVNAKNRFGGYTGFQSMVVTYMSGTWYSLQSLRDSPISCLDLIVDLQIKDKTK